MNEIFFVEFYSLFDLLHKESVYVDNMSEEAGSRASLLECL